MSKFQTHLCEALNITTPIIQAPMGPAVTPQFACEVAEQGALAVLPLATYSLEKCEQLIDETQRLTDKPIAANLILDWGQTERLELCLQKGIQVICFFGEIRRLMWIKCMPRVRQSLQPLGMLKKPDTLLMPV